MITRYLVHMAYDGTPFCGWQRQPNDPSVQEHIESAFKTLYQKDIQIVGCGRTDTGVHASHYYFHVDLEKYLDNLVYKLNAILPYEIVIYDFNKVNHDFHARFDAIKRAYVYFAHHHKDPFKTRFSSKIPELRKASLSGLNKTASLLLNYNSFEPFCKSHADNKTFICQLSRCEWLFNDKNQYELHVESDRFLRGMIRLIVGACILVESGKLFRDDIMEALENRTRLKKNLSAPPEGLFLNKVEYSL